MKVAAAVSFASLLLASPGDSRDALAMRVSSPGPGALRVHIAVQPHAQNRAVVVSAESADFYRSGLVQLDGEGAPRVTVLEFRSVPTNIYEVTGVLVGSTGPRGTVMRMARVPPNRWGR